MNNLLVTFASPLVATLALSPDLGASGSIGAPVTVTAFYQLDLDLPGGDSFDAGLYIGYGPDGAGSPCVARVDLVVLDGFGGVEGPYRSGVDLYGSRLGPGGVAVAGHFGEGRIGDVFFSIRGDQIYSEFAPIGGGPSLSFVSYDAPSYF